VSWLVAVILGAVQGATEFLPVSSSGHLVIFSRLCGCPELPLAFVVITHFGTLLAVVAYYRRDFADMIRSLLVWSPDEGQPHRPGDARPARQAPPGGKQEGPVERSEAGPRDKVAVLPDESEVHGRLRQSRRLVVLLLVGTIPAAVAGVLFEDKVEELFSNIVAVGAALVITGLILLAVNWLSGRKEEERTTVVDALVIGVAQAAALVPGISRSGSTIAAGLGRGLHRDWAPRFAFLLSAPVILGGSGLEIVRLIQQPVASAQLAMYLLGGLVAAATGYFAVHLVVKAVRQGNLIYFSGYCIVFGIAVVLAGGMLPG